MASTSLFLQLLLLLLPALLQARLPPPVAEPLVTAAAGYSEDLPYERPPKVYKIGGRWGWSIQQYEDITDARVGDSLEFVYNPYNTVWRVPHDYCFFGKGMKLAGKMESPFTVVLNEPGVFHYSDATHLRCDVGKLFTVIVSERP